MGPAFGGARKGIAARRGRGGETRSHTVVQTQQMAAASGRKRFAASEPSVPHADAGEETLKDVPKKVEALIEECVKGLPTLGHVIRRWLRSAKASEPCVQPGKTAERIQPEALCRLHDPIRLLYAASLRET